MNLTDSKVYQELKHRKKVLEEQLAYFNHDREITERELSFVNAALKAIEQPKNWTHW